MTVAEAKPEIATQEIYARQLSWTYRPGDYNRRGVLNSRYDLACSGECVHRIRVESIDQKTCTAYVWRPCSLDWSEVAAVEVSEKEYPPTKWISCGYSCPNNDIHPALRELRDGSVRLPGLDGTEHDSLNQQVVVIHNDYVRQIVNRDIAIEVEREVLKRAAWALFGRNVCPQILDSVTRNLPAQVRNSRNPEDPNLYPPAP